MIVLACLCAWVLGGVPFGLVLVRALLGVDIRAIGSGNVGATNAARAFSGRRRLAVFLLIYVLDFAKGFVPVVWFPAWFGLGEAGSTAPVLVGAAAVLGHCASPFLGLRGGKGVATTCGVFAALTPWALLSALVVFGIVRLLSGRVFFGSLALGLTLAGAVILRAPATAFGERLPETLLACAAAAFLFWTHRSNLAAWRAARRGGALT